MQLCPEVKKGLENLEDHLEREQVDSKIQEPEDMKYYMDLAC